MGRWNARRRAGGVSAVPLNPLSAVLAYAYEGSVLAEFTITEDITAHLELIDVSDGGTVVEDVPAAAIPVSNPIWAFSWPCNPISTYKVRSTVEGFSPVESPEFLGS